LIGGLVGFILGLASAFIIDVWDDRLRRRDKVELVTSLPVIAEVPVLPRTERQDNAISALDAPRSRSAERYRSIRTTIMFALDSRLQSEPSGNVGTNEPDRAPVVLVTSPSPGEGKTTTTANIASVFADSGSRTLIVDCDYRKPSIGKYLVPIPNVQGDDSPCRTRLNNLWFIPAPKMAGSPAETIQELQNIIERWRGHFDIVLLDTPPMLTTNDATDLLDVADHVVLVIRSGQTRIGPAERVASLLSRFQANVIGVVLNGCSAADMDSYYGYYYYYGGSGSRGYYGNHTPAATPAITEPDTATPQN
jgi:capsular exopolysaccharide synthesis family protein